MFYSFSANVLDIRPKYDIVKQYYKKKNATLIHLTPLLEHQFYKWILLIYLNFLFSQVSSVHIDLFKFSVFSSVQCPHRD